MNTANKVLSGAQQKISDKRQEAMEKMKLSKTIGDWVTRNKKVFWKYEVSCFYKTYSIKISNLPEPSASDIHPFSLNKILSEQQKKQLCDAVTKACANSKVFNDQSIDVQIDYDNGTVITEVI